MVYYVLKFYKEVQNWEDWEDLPEEDLEKLIIGDNSNNSNKNKKEIQELKNISKNDDYIQENQVQKDRTNPISVGAEAFVKIRNGNKQEILDGNQYHKQIVRDYEKEGRNQEHIIQSSNKKSGLKNELNWQQQLQLQQYENDSNFCNGYQFRSFKSPRNNEGHQNKYQNSRSPTRHKAYNESPLISEYEALNNYSHVLEVVDINRKIYTEVLEDYLEEFRLVRVPKPKTIWVNDFTALYVCSDADVANYMLMSYKDTKSKFCLRPFAEASQDSWEVRKQSLEPPSQIAPRKNSSVAQRFIAHHLNLKLDPKNVQKQELEEEKQRIEQKKRLIQKQKDLINEQIRQSQQQSAWDD